MRSPSILPTIVFTFFLARCSGSRSYKCSDGRSKLEDVFGQYGPLCDGTSHCDDGSDEQFCDYEAESLRYTGCWSYIKAADQETLIIAECSSCLCRADVEDCSAMDFLEQDCKICVTSEDKIDNNVHDCVFGIDESNDAKVLKGFFPNSAFHLSLNHGKWKCNDKRNADAVKHCGSVIKEDRQPFLYSFPQWKRPDSDADDVSNAVDGKLPDLCANFKGKYDLEFRFWTCASGKCVRDVHHCDGNCPSGYELDRYTGSCEKLECQSYEWECNQICIDQHESCNGRCFLFKLEYFCPHDGSCKTLETACGPNKVCPMDHMYCDQDERCVKNTEPCSGRCLAPRRHYCLSSNTCLYAHENCFRRCPEGHYYCLQRCHNLNDLCDGSCFKGRWLCQRESVEECIPDRFGCSGACKEGLEACEGFCVDTGGCRSSPVITTTLKTTTRRSVTTSTTSTTVASETVSLLEPDNVTFSPRLLEESASNSPVEDSSKGSIVDFVKKRRSSKTAEVPWLWVGILLSVLALSVLVLTSYWAISARKAKKNENNMDKTNYGGTGSQMVLEDLGRVNPRYKNTKKRLA